VKVTGKTTVAATRTTNANATTTETATISE
jgi:hypothetical protein